MEPSRVTHILMASLLEVAVVFEDFDKKLLTANHVQLIFLHVLNRCSGFTV